METIINALINTYEFIKPELGVMAAITAGLFVLFVLSRLGGSRDTIDDKF